MALNRQPSCQLVYHLQPYGYFSIPNCPGLWAHKSRKTRFSLCVDDFGIKYFSQKDAQHLFNALRQAYEISVNYEGDKYCGLNIKWNYKEGFVDISMPLL